MLRLEGPAVLQWDVLGAQVPGSCESLPVACPKSLAKGLG